MYGNGEQRNIRRGMKKIEKNNITNKISEIEDILERARQEEIERTEKAENRKRLKKEEEEMRLKRKWWRRKEKMVEKKLERL